MLGCDSWPRWVVRFSDIERYEQMSNVALCWWMYGNNIHPVPEHYKYDWWIFWEGAPVDGEMLIFNEQYRMNTAEASSLYVRLMSTKTTFFMYNRKRPRQDSANPFDPSAEKWRGVDWAPSLANDPDPVVAEGAWAGHR
ncbi:hypothetical protein [Alcanivorax jadensis]|uniref:hypothetical protein n=1 Tax=Alcanivorax jadensis TaxID=64988 RepID=UPI00240A58D8|nr:hypothetical protein [Alcanivorax jadensis]MDF1637663.1 hypothetical protein [Alcanivorax jadensis]